jgi:low affinity Fe/Cu permease
MTKPSIGPGYEKHRLFTRFTRWIERQVGSSLVFVFAVAVVVAWAITGPFFDWSDAWQLAINTGTTVVTFLMVFVIQNTQSRDTRAMQIKLDELLKVNQDARNSLINLEEQPDTEIDKKKAEFQSGSLPEPPKCGRR